MHSQWFKDPDTTSYALANSTNLNQIFTATSMYYEWMWIANQSTYSSVYLGYQNERMFIQYPAMKSSFWNWTRTNDTCEYFASGKMDFYDVRCRPFYKKAIQYSNKTTMYGPYFNPAKDNRFYAITYSQAIFKGTSIIGVQNIDLILNFSDQYDSLLDVNNEFNHYFVTSEGVPLYHSTIEIVSDNATLTRTEFSQSNQSLDSEPDTDEAVSFNKTILPLTKMQTNGTQSSFLK